MESNSVCNHSSDNKIRTARSGSPICLSLTIYPPVTNEKKQPFDEDVLVK